jgi:hypothetical protein
MARVATKLTPKKAGGWYARKRIPEDVRDDYAKRAANVVPIIREIQSKGAMTLREVADALNARGIVTARGGKWYATSVKNMLERVPLC